MHTRSLAMVALLASTALGTAAFADGDTSATGTEGTDAANTSVEPAAGTDDTAATDVEAATGAGEDGTATATEKAAADASKPTDDMMNRTDEEEVYRSMRSEADTFQGTIANEFSVDELMDREVVDVTGEHIGEVNDLLIGSDDTVSKAIVDVGGFLGIGEKTVAIDISNVQLEQGDGGTLVVDITREQAEALPAYEQTDSGWELM